MKTLGNSIWGNQFLYLRSIRLNLHHHTAALLSAWSRDWLYWAQTRLFLVNPPCPFGTLISTLLFFFLFPFQFFLTLHLYQTFSLNSSISIDTPILFLPTMQSPFPSYFPWNELCVSSESSNPQRSHSSVQPNDTENTWGHNKSQVQTISKQAELFTILLSMDIDQKPTHPFLEKNVSTSSSQKCTDTQITSCDCNSSTLAMNA